MNPEAIQAAEAEAAKWISANRGWADPRCLGPVTAALESVFGDDWKIFEPMKIRRGMGAKDLTWTLERKSDHKEVKLHLPLIAALHLTIGEITKEIVVKKPADSPRLSAPKVTPQPRRYESCHYCGLPTVRGYCEECGAVPAALRDIHF